MTLIVALRCRDGVTLGSDSQDTRGEHGRRLARSTQKVYAPRRGFLLAWAGAQDVAQSFALRLERASGISPPGRPRRPSTRLSAPDTDRRKRSSIPEGEHPITVPTREPTPPSPAASSAELATFGPVHLDVVEEQRSLRFWRDVVGLRLLRRTQDALELGVDRDTLIALHPGATSPTRRGHSGLYHVAIHLPDEPELARVLARLIARRLPIAPTDHLISKAIYLSDPDGIGLELTLETPERGEQRGLQFFDPQGRHIDHSGREPLDVEQLLRQLADSDVDRPLPAHTFVGHVHLNVGDLHRALAFYRDDLGFLEANVIPALRFADLHAGGRFKHRIALNTWQGTGARPAPSGTAGLRCFTIRYDSPLRLKQALTKVEVLDRLDGEALVRDPDGNAIHLGA